MPAYIVYNKISGKILRQGNSFKPERHINELDQESFLISDHPTVGFKVDIETKELIECEITPTIMDVIRSINEPDEILNSIIAKIDTDVSAWRKKTYSILRYNAYPPITEYIDAQVKLSSSDPAIIAQGQTQIDKYYTACLAVKTRFSRGAE